MPVGVESDLDRRMAKALHDRPRVRPLLDQHGGTGVAKVVESETIQSEGLDGRPVLPGLRLLKCSEGLVGDLPPDFC